SPLCSLRGSGVCLAAVMRRFFPTNCCATRAPALTACGRVFVLVLLSWADWPRGAETAGGPFPCASRLRRSPPGFLTMSDNLTQQDKAPVRQERHGGVGVIVIDRPERKNALNSQVKALLIQNLRELEQDAGIGCIVLTG